MSTLKLTPSYLNSYEAAHKILSKNPWFQESDWLSMARSGELDQYITVLANTDKITDKDKFYSDYNYAYADDQTRVAALYNELLADRSNVDEPRKKLALDSSGNVILDAKGKPTYESFKASDYDYYKSVIKNRNDEHYQEYLIEQEKERKNSMNGFVKFLGDTASIGTELVYGLANQIDNLTNSIAAIGDGITAYFKDEDVADAIVDTNASDTWRWFEQLGVQDWIVDFERRYTNVRDLDGNYSNTGKYLGGICSTLGQMLPSMVGGKVVGSAAQKAGAAAKTVNTLSQISSTLIFYQGITAGNIRDMYKQFAAEKASVPSGAILANASIKSALQWAVEIGLAKISGGSTIDNVVFGRSIRTSAGSTLAKSAGKRLLSDFVTEGLEEVFQDTSDWLVDKAFSVLINENFGKVTEISYQSLMDSFIIGGLASFAGSALNIVTTKKVATGQVKTNKKGDTKLDKKGNVKAEKLGKLASWEYGLDMQSFMKNYVELQEQAKGFLKRYDKDSNEAKKYAAAITEMYAAYRMLSSIYGEIGETRFKNANQVLSEITNLVNNGKFTNDSAYNIGQELMNSLTDLKKNSLQKTLVALEKAKITQLADVIERDSDLTQLDIDEDTKKSIQQLFDGDDNVKKVILTKDGANIAVVDDSLFVPINYAKNADGSTLYETVAEQTLVEAISKGKFKGDVLNLVLETFKKVTGRNDASMEEAIYNLVFNDSFFNIMLSTANKDMYSLLSSLISIEDNVVSNKLRDKIYKKKIATVVESMTQSLYDYCINQPYADYRLDVFTKTQMDKIAATRWCRNLYARVIDNTSYKHLTDNDWNVLNNRVNSLPVSQQQKDKILTALKSSNKDTRASAMNKIALVYKGIFTTNYDGTVYMPDTNVANRTFNSWLQSIGLTIETLTSPEIDENTKKTISELYGAFTTENLIKFRQSQFMQYCNNSFIFRYDKQGKLGIYEHETNKQVGFSEYRTNAEAVLAGNDFDKRTTLERSYKKNYLVKEILNNEIDAATAAYLSIDDVISNPSLLSEKMLADIQMTYGDVNQTSTFLYLREYFINKFKTTTVVVLSDGTYGFADIRPMKSMLKTENFSIDKNTKIKDIIKDDYLKGRLKDVKIKLTDRGIVAEYNAEENTIYINEFRAAKKGPYLTFAVLHEFQHAIQVENGMNLGMNVNWINSVAKTTKAAIIADVRKHRPELFTDVAKGSKDEANIVNNFVYYSSGESTAYGIDASQLVNYYPTVVNADKGIKITFPWGKTYNISSNVPVSIKLRNLYNKVFTLLNESAYEKYFNAIKDTTDITPFSSQLKSLEIYRNLLDSIKEISEYISVGLGTVQDVSEVKQRLLNRITPDVKNQMLKMMYFKLGMTGISFDEFLQMDIPFVRVQNNITSKPDAFLSASVTTDANLTLDKCLDFIMKTDIVKGWNNEQVTPTDKLTIVVGTIKPADCIGFLGTKLDEVLLPVDVVNKSKKYTIDINDYVPTGNPEPVYEFVETMDLDNYNPLEQNVSGEDVLASESVRTYSNLGPSDSMSIKQPGDIENKRYVTQKEGKDTNLEKYGYTAKYKRTQMDTKLKNFIINANEDIASELWNKVKSGKITTSDVMDYLRDADKIDDKTFKLINDSFFKNSKIKTFEELKAKIAESSKYYAMRAVLKSAGFGEALLTNANPELFNGVLEIINKDEKLKKLFDEIDSRYHTYRQQGLDISEKYLRKLWMEYFDGTVAAGGYIAAIAKIAAISKWKVTGEGSTISTRSLDDTVGKDMALEEVLEDVSAKDAFSYILNNGDRSDKIDDIIKAVTPKIIKKLREMGPLKAEKYLQQKREQLEEMSDRDFIKSYKKYVEGQSEEEINKMFLKTIIVETGAIDISKLSDQQLDQLEITANTISKKVDRPNTAVVNNIKSLVRTIKANLSKKDTTRFLKDNGDIFDNNLDVKKDLYQTVDDKGRIRLKDASELLELENRVRQLSKSVRANDYSSDQSLRFRKKMNRELEKLRIENEHLAEKLGKDKGHVQPIVYEIADDVITIDTKKEIPLALKRILEHQFTKTAKTKVQYLSEKDEQHVKMNFKSFIADNVENLLALTQSDVDQIIDFYLTSDILTGTNKYRQYIATEIYLGTYILTNAKSGRFLLTDEQYSNLNERIKNVVSTGTAAGAAWKSVLPMLKPEETLIQSAAKSTGIEFAVSDVQALVEATNSGDIERIQAAKTAMYENALKSYKGIKRSFFDRLLKFERMAMLSGPGTWVRNQVSNLMVVAGNKAAEYVSGPIVKMLDKLFPKKFKHRDNQYKLVGTKVTSEVQTFIKREIIDSKILELVRDGFSKYDTRKYKPNEVSSEQSLADLIQNSIRSQIMKDTYSNSKVVNETYKFLFKMLSDNKYIDKAAIKYLGKILTEDNVNLNEGLSTDVLNHIADAYVMAAQDFMHTTNFFNDIETKLKERLGDKAFFMYKQIMPFAAASWNWFTAGLKYTPVGLIQGIYQYAKLENTIEKIENRKQKGEQVASSRFAEYIAKRNIGKGVIGTIGCAIGIALAAFGVAGIDEEDGKYKLHVGDVYVDISDIFSTQGIFVGIAAFSSIKSGDIWSAMGNVLDVMFLDSTFTDMFNSFRYSETFGDWLRDQPFSILSMFIPNMLKVLTSTTYGHKVQYSKGILGKLERIAAQSIPGMAYALPKQYDPYTGEYQIQYKVWFLTKLVDKLSPLDIYAYNISEQEKIAMSLGVKKGPLTGRYKINGEKINLNSKELSEANKFYGELNSKDLKEFISGTKKYKVFDDKKGKYVELTYSKMTDKQKAAVIDRIMSNNSSKAQIYILTKHGYYKYYASQEEYKELKKLGINVQKASGNKKGFLNS